MIYPLSRPCAAGIAGFVLMFCFLHRGRARTDAVSRAIQGGWIALFASLLFYCCVPVVRWDYVIDGYNSAIDAQDPEALTEYDRAISLSPDAQRILREARDANPKKPK